MKTSVFADSSLKRKVHLLKTPSLERLEITK